MSVLGLDLNDAALTGVAGGELLFSEPGYALDDEGELLFGAAARAAARRQPRKLQNRYWRELSDEPLPAPVGGARSTADLVCDQLARLWKRAGTDCDAVAVAVPPYWTADQVGLFLGIAEEIGMPVAGLADGSIAQCRRQYPDRQVLAVDLSLHDATLSVITQDGAAGLGSRDSVAGVGTESLERTLVEAIAAGFVAGARFDPLQHADTEQAVYNQLDDWMSALAREPKLDVALAHGGREFSAVLEREAIAGRLTGRCQPLLQPLRALLPADGAVALLLSGRPADYPGFADTLAALPGVELFLLDAAARARGAGRALGLSGEDGYRLARRLPWDQPPASAPASAPATAAASPTHLVFEARAYRIGESPLVIGSEVSPGDYGILLRGRVAGVSRQHCSLRREHGRVLLTDHSRYGTRLNGHRIRDTAVLQPGDVIELGSPARELLLVAEASDDGS